MRGHTLMWHNQLPDWLTTGVADGSISNAQLKDLLHQHITTEVSRYKGKIWQWDVANEFFLNTFDSTPPLPDSASTAATSGCPISVRASSRTRSAGPMQADPHALLCYNDFNIAGEDGTNAKYQAVHDFVANLKAQGVPIHCVGEQGHLDTQYGFSGTRFQQDLQGYADLHLKVAVTEADVRTFVTDTTSQVPTNNPETLAQPYEFGQMLKACLSVRNCISFTIWGFDDAEELWVPGVFAGEGYADIYDVNLNKKDAYNELQQDLKLAAFGAPDRPDTF